MVDSSKENNEACVFQQPFQELDIVKDSEDEQTLEAWKESLIPKRKVLNITNNKLARVEKRVWFELPHDHSTSKL